MLERINPVTILIVGFVFVLAGVLLPLLMVLRYIESTFPLNFLAYSLSLIGVMCGFIGSAYYVKRNRKK